MNDDYWISSNMSLTTNQIYDMLLDAYKNKGDKVMSWNYNRSYYDSTGDEVATAVLEAYSKGIDFNTLLKKNSTIRGYWHRIQSQKIAKEQARQRELERQRKLAEKRAIEQAKREEVMQKLSQEELEAFGLRKGKKK